MTRSVLIVALALAGGCGDLSNDDLVFLTGVPRAEEISVGIEAEGSTPNALTGLVGEPAEYYTEATNIATYFDAIVGESIDYVENLSWRHPPTHRTESTRVWGPVHDVNGSGVTLRLEIRRDQSDDGPIFTFCLHAGPDGFSEGRDPSCEMPADGGLRLLMWGSFVPRAGDDNGRAGRGDIHVDFEAVHALNPEEEGRGLLSIGYDFTGGGNARALHIEWVRIVSLVGLSTERFEYDFEAPGDGSHAFDFVYEGDVYADAGRPLGFTDIESVAVAACWAENGPGRADISFTNGDLLFGETGTSLECWDPHHDRTYWYMGVGSTPYEEEGDVALCPAVCGL